MDYLRTTRDDKATFQMMVWALGFATVCSLAGSLDLFSEVHSRRLFGKIIEFFTTNVPSWIWNIVSTAICIAFLLMLRNGLPKDGQPIAGVTKSIITLESLECLLDCATGIFPELEDWEIYSLSTEITILILYCVLGVKLRKNYTGKVKKLGRLFIWYSLLILVVSILLIWAVLSLDLEEDGYRYEKYDNIWQVLISIIYIGIMTGINLLPWDYESKLLIEGIEHYDLEEDEPEDGEKNENVEGIQVVALQTTATEAVSPIQTTATEGEATNEAAIREAAIREAAAIRDAALKEAAAIRDAAVNEASTNAAFHGKKPKTSKSKNKKTLIWVGVGCLVAAGIIIAVVYGLKSKGGNTGKVPIDKELLVGDFDGDGEYDQLWIEGELGEDDFAVTPFVLRSDNPKLDGLSWDAPCGVMLFNLGRLDDSGRDFLGAIPYAMSDWASYHVYSYEGGDWRSEIEPFTVYLDSEEDFSNRVHRSSTPGYIMIFENDVTANDVHDLQGVEVRLKRR